MNRQFSWSTVSFALAFFAGISTSQAAPLELSNVPVFLKEDASPNLIVTLDDSGSMAWGYVPDSISGEYDEPAFRSSTFNPMYYDPSVTYVQPKDQDGNTYPKDSDGDSESLTTSFTRAYKHGFVSSEGTRDLSTSYRITRTYNPASSGETTWDPPNDDGHAHYTKFDASNSGCNGSVYDDDCWDIIKIGSAEDETAGTEAQQKQNFANWFSFYRTRYLAMSSSILLSFNTLSEDVRVAWQNLHRCDGFDSNCQNFTGESAIDSRLDVFTGTHRDNFFNWVAKAPASGGTPLREAIIRAGESLRTTGQYSLFNDTPKTSSLDADNNVVVEEASCRPTYHIAFTDGIWNDDDSNTRNYMDDRTPGIFNNYDSTNQTTPESDLDSDNETFDYTAAPPFSDCDVVSDSTCLGTNYNQESGYPISVADLTLYYWLNDARDDIDNRVPRFMPIDTGDAEEDFWNPRNDPSSWQNMVTYTIAFGLSGILTDPQFGDGTFDGVNGDYDEIADGTKSWPRVSDDNSNNPYDLWHAAINSRGEFFGADDPDSMVEAFQSILNRIGDRQTSASAVALDSAVISGLNVAYHASFNSDGWTGNLKSFAIDPDTLEPSTTTTWGSGDGARAILDAQAPASRNIYLADSAGDLVEFTWANLDATQQGYLNTDSSGANDGLGEQRVSFLRGDRSEEGGLFRDRKFVLGDIIYSSPIYVGAPSYFATLLDGVEGLSPTDANSYENFKSTWSSRQPLVYVGANDGMLHAFNASTGSEEFAFIPGTVVPKIAKLSYPTYSHDSFVDGPQTTFDVFINDAWKTVLIGALGAGGRGIYALDVTDPDNVELLWEFDNSDDSDVGYTYGRPVIVRVSNGDWVALIGNGYNSDSHEAKLFAIKIADGSVLKEFSTGVGSLASPNGLAAPTPVDVNGDLVTDYVYAGDLQGNMWRFDFIDTSATSPLTSSSTPANWGIAFGGEPLYTAKDGTTAQNVQPITTRPRAIPHPEGPGHLVVFGTGKLMESSDSTYTATANSRVNSIYGIWDRYTSGQATTSATLSTRTRSDLQQQLVYTAETQSFTRIEDDGTEETETQDIRQMTQNAVEWYDPDNPGTVSKEGYFFDLATYTSGGTLTTAGKKGEMLVTDIVVRADILFFISNIPLDDSCSPGLERWFQAVDVYSGGRPRSPALDLNGDRSVDNYDKIGSTASGDTVGSVKIPGEGLTMPTIAGETAFFGNDTTVGRIQAEFGANEKGRQSWREVK